MEKQNKPSTDPSEQNVSSEEGKDVASKADTTPKTKEEQAVEDEIQEAIDKLKEEEKPKEEEKEKEEEKKEEEKVDDLASNFTVEELNTLSGRSFKDKEDFVKHYKNLASAIGVPTDEIKELRDKAKAHDQMLKDAEEVEKLLSSKDKKVDKKKDDKLDITDEIKKQTSPIDDEVSKIKQELADAKFLKNHPNAETYLDIIKAVAVKEDKALEEVFVGSDLESLIDDSKSLKDVKDKEKDLGVQSKGRLTLNKNEKINDLVRQLKIAEGGGKNRDVAEIKQQLVEEKLKIGLENQENLF